MKINTVRMTGVRVDVDIDGMDGYTIDVVPTMVDKMTGDPLPLRADIEVRISHDPDEKPRLVLIEEEAQKLTAGLICALHRGGILDEATKDIMRCLVGNNNQLTSRPDAQSYRHD